MLTASANAWKDFWSGMHDNIAQYFSQVLEAWTQPALSVWSLNSAQAFKPALTEQLL